MDAMLFERFVREAQEVPMDEAVVLRALGVVNSANTTARRAADERLRFEDEPAQFTKLLESHEETRA